MSNALLYCTEPSLHLSTSSSRECTKLALKSMHFSQHAVPLMWLTETSYTIKSVHEMAVSCPYKAQFFDSLSFFFCSMNWILSGWKLNGRFCVLTTVYSFDNSIQLSLLKACFDERVQVQFVSVSLWSTLVDSGSLPVLTYLVTVSMNPVLIIQCKHIYNMLYSIHYTLYNP